MTTLRPGPVPSPACGFRFAFARIATLAAALLSLLLLVTSPSATAYEPFKVASQNLGAISSKPVVTGTNWVAYFQSTPNSASTDKSQIAVMSTLTRIVLKTIPAPANVTTFGLQMITDGNYLATLSYASGSTVIHLWKVPAATSPAIYVGTVNFSGSLSDPNTAFIGLGNGRLIAAASGNRTIRQWNAADLAPLPDITLPANIPDWTGSAPGNFALGGDDFICRSRYAADVYHLFHVKLSTGVITDLPVPPDFGNRSLTPSAVANGRLIATASPSVYLGPTSMFHYDLATEQIVSETPLPGGFFTRAFFAPDASSWAAVSIDSVYGKPSELRTGSIPEVPGTTAFQLPPNSIVTGNTAAMAYPFAYSQNHLWFSGGAVAETNGFQSGVDAEGIVAYRIPLFNRPVATLTARCLPCQESDGRLQFLFTLSHPLDHDVHINVRTASDQGTATPGVDYQPVETQFTFPANQTQALLEIPLIQDEVIEENETLVLLLTGRPGVIHASETQYPGVIGGSSFHRLPPVRAWEDVEPLRVRPHSIALAGDHLVQSNTYTTSPSNAGTAPRVLTRPLIGGAWTPSASLASIAPIGNGIYTNEAGLAALTSYEAVRFYEPATDTLRFQTSGTWQTILGDTHVPTPGWPIKEYALDAPYASRAPVAGSFLTGIDRAAYGQDVLVAALRDLPDGGLHMISRTTSADLGQLIPGWKSLPTYIAAGGNVFAAANGTRGWFRPIDQPGQLRPLCPAYGPLVNVAGLRVSGNRILVTDTPTDQPPSIRIFDGTSGLELGTLLADRNDSLAETDFSAYLPEGLVIPPNLFHPPAEYALQNLTTSGKNIVAAITWPQITRSRHLVAAAFTQEASLPGIVDPAPIREDHGDIAFMLTEAAPWPLTITARAIPTLDNEPTDWTGSGATIVIPAGTTSFSTGLAPVDDHVPEATIPSPIELTISGNGITRTLRTAVQVLDNERLQLSEVDHTLENLGSDFTPVAGGWAYRTLSEDQQNLIAWSEDPAFTHGTSFGAAGSAGFASAFAATGDWLAVTQDAFVLSAKKVAPSQIQIYQPASKGKTPVRILKGMKDINNFGKTLYARDKTLWVAAPGSAGSGPKPKVTAGQVLQYDLTTGKKTRTFKAPKTHPVGFGTTITANDTSVWIGSPVSDGTIFQYSRAKGKLLRTIDTPEGVEIPRLGEILASTNTGLLLASSQYESTTYNIHGYSESTAQRLWSLHAPDDRRFNTFTLFGDEILAAAAEDSLIFYHLAPASPPELLVEVLIPGADVRIRRLAASSTQLAIHRDQSGTTPDDTILINLADIEKLAPFLPNLPAALTDTGESHALTTGTLPLPPALALARSPAGLWQLQLPLPATAAATSTTLQFSTDLGQWHPLATSSPDGTAWQLLPGTPLAAPALINGTTLQIPTDIPQLYFRLHTP